MRFNGEARDGHCDGCGTAIPITTSGRRVPGGGSRSRRLDSTNSEPRSRGRTWHAYAITTSCWSSTRSVREVRRRAGISRSLTGLTFQTIENISRRLIEAGILEDVPLADDRSPTSAGPATGWCVRGRHRGGAAKDGGSPCATSTGRTLAEQRLALGTTSLDSSLDELTLMVQDLIDDAEVPITTVVAVGLTAPSSRCGGADGHGASTRGAPRATRMGARWTRAAAPDACPVHQRGHRCSAGRAVVRSDLLAGLRLRASRVGDRVRRRQPWPALYRGERPWRRHRAHARRDQR